MLVAAFAGDMGLVSAGEHGLDVWLMSVQDQEAVSHCMVAVARFLDRGTGSEAEMRAQRRERSRTELTSDVVSASGSVLEHVSLSDSSSRRKTTRCLGAGSLRFRSSRYV